MWFEILPAMAIIFGAMGFPHYGAYWLNYFVVGNYYRRSLYTRRDRMQYLRDTRLTNNPYKVFGLENIPDEEEKVEEPDEEAKAEEPDEEAKAEEPDEEAKAEEPDEDNKETTPAEI